MRMPAKERVARYRQKRYAEIASMPKIPCACGCGTLIPPINKQLRPAKYAHGHNPNKELFYFKKGHPDTRTSETFKKAVKTRRERDGYRRSPEVQAKMVATRKNKGSYKAWNKGLPMRDESRITLSQSLKGLLVGSKNPFYGKKHPPELQEKISAQIRGELHPNWAGGTSILPYGPGFTRRFKKLIRERDSHKCQRCGHKQQKGERALEVHHIDHDKTNNDPTNLITVCGSCNVWLSCHRDTSLIAFPKRRMFLE